MSYLPEKFQTSFMDIILGTLGAFFLLLIIISTNHAGEQEKGSNLPGNILCLRVTDRDFDFLRFYKDIGFWVGILDDDGNLEVVWYSDETHDGNINCKNKIDINNTNRNVSSEFATILRVSDDDRERIVVGCWLRELPPHFPVEKKEKLLNKDEGIQIEVLWNKQKATGKLLITNNFEFAVQPGIGERDDLLPALKVTAQKPKQYESFPHEKVNDLSLETLFPLDNGAQLRFTYNRSGTTLNKLGRFLPEGDPSKNSIPVYFSRRTTEFPLIENNKLNVVDIAFELMYGSNKKPGDTGYGDYIHCEDYSRIKSIHTGDRAVALVMENQSVMYHLFDRIDNDEVKAAYPYHGWKKIYPSPDDGATAKWETISAEEINKLKENYPDLGDDFVYAFAKYLAEPLPDQGTEEEPLPFRRNPMIELWSNMPVPVREITEPTVQ